MQRASRLAAAAAARATQLRSIQWTAATAARQTMARTGSSSVSSLIQRQAITATTMRISCGLSLCAVRRAHTQTQTTQQQQTTAPATTTPAAAAVPVASSAFTAPPASIPAPVSLSSLGDLSSFSPRLPKHSTHGYLVYSSPMEKALRAVKMFSLSSAAMALLSAPVMMILANPNMSVVGRGAIAGTVMVFGVSTTIALTYFTRSYVVRIFAKQDPVRAEKVKVALAAEAAAAKASAQAAAAAASDATEPAASSTPVSSATATAPTGPASGRAAAAAPRYLSESDRLASESWLLTVETLNLWGRSVFRTMPHSSFHPLFSALFNNLHAELSEDEAKERGLTPAKKDLFIHMDLATNPLLLPLWSKATVLARNLSPLEADEQAEQQSHKQQAAASAASAESDDRMTVEQAHKVLEAHKAKRAAAAAAATKSEQ